MNKYKSRWVRGCWVCAMLTLLAPGAPLVRAEVTPTQVVGELLDKVKQIKKADASKNITLNAEEQKQNASLSRQVNKILDIEGISAFALQDQWSKRSADERRAFVNLFTSLLEKVAYTNTAKFMKDLTASINQEKIVGDKAMVYTSVMHQKEGRVDIDFKLRKAAGGWLVEDVQLDGVSLVRNLRTQCNKIVRENSFQELLRRMKRKLDGDEDTDKDLEDITERRS
ncbi:MAG: ABC transporter substrate-binding protein [Rubrivivax sp.]|nr:ABC transporter substrate-binding protein [Rubrivivax sp.]